MISTPFLPVPPPYYGGTELVVANLTTELVRRGHEVVLYATGDSRSGVDVRAHYRTAVWPPNPYRELTHVHHAIFDLLAANQVDVIHTHCASALAFARIL